MSLEESCRPFVQTLITKYFRPRALVQIVITRFFLVLGGHANLQEISLELDSMFINACSLSVTHVSETPMSRMGKREWYDDRCRMDCDSPAKVMSDRIVRMRRNMELPTSLETSGGLVAGELFPGIPGSWLVPNMVSTASTVGNETP